LLRASSQRRGGWARCRLLRGREYGRLDMAFNNAGIQVPPSDAADEPIENFERVTAVNQRGVWGLQ
jgi:NAD(P)-dependent dehydrogenase (short-subunit alcohol dehydrogenase family)